MSQPVKKVNRPQSVIVVKQAPNQQGGGQPVVGMMDPGKLINLMEQCVARGFQIQTLRMIRRHITEPPSASWMDTFISRNGPEILFKLMRLESITLRYGSNKFLTLLYLTNL
jgi:hypothetical protein